MFEKADIGKSIESCLGGLEAERSITEAVAVGTADGESKRHFVAGSLALED